MCPVEVLKEGVTHLTLGQLQYCVEVQTCSCDVLRLVGDFQEFFLAF